MARSVWELGINCKEGPEAQRKWAESMWHKQIEQRQWLRGHGPGGVRVVEQLVAMVHHTSRGITSKPSPGLKIFCILLSRPF